jgi:hypothetical protein
MERLAHSLKLLWRSERLLRQNEFRLAAQKIQFIALAALVAVFGLVMVSLAVFFALVPYWGQSLAALAVGGADLVLAMALVVYAGSIKPAAESEMVKEMRDLALDDIEEEVARAEAELVELKDDVHKFISNPVDTLLPAAIGPIMSAVARGLGTGKE